MSLEGKGLIFNIRRKFSQIPKPRPENIARGAMVVTEAAMTAAGAGQSAQLPPSHEIANNTQPGIRQELPADFPAAINLSTGSGDLQLANTAEAAEITQRKAAQFETIGASAPLSQTQLDQKIQDWNSTTNTTEMRPDTYYDSFFISESIYKSLPSQIDGESVESFLTRHANELSRMLSEADPSVSTGFAIRRLVVLKDGVTPPGSWYSGYLQNGIKDSDGTSLIPDPGSQLHIVNGIYKPKENNYYNAAKKIDYSLIRELWALPVLHLNDDFALDFAKPTNPNSVLIDVQDAWREYKSSIRTDIALGDLMTQVASNFKRYNALKLNRRTQTHNFAETLKDYQGFPVEYPTFIGMKLKSKTGTIITPTSVQIFRTQGTGNGYDKILLETPVYQGADLKKIDPTAIFRKNQDGVIDVTEGSLFMKIRASDGTMYYRWLDIRDFNIAKWQGKNTMEFIVGNGSDDPNTLDPTINYSVDPSLIKYQILLPTIPDKVSGPGTNP